jgi:hypothetical protein
MVRFWNNVAAMRPDTLHYRVLLHDLRLAIVEGKETFAGTLVQQLKKLGYCIADHVQFDILIVSYILTYPKQRTCWNIKATYYGMV